MVPHCGTVWYHTTVPYGSGAHSIPEESSAMEEARLAVSSSSSSSLSSSEEMDLGSVTSSSSELSSLCVCVCMSNRAIRWVLPCYAAQVHEHIIALAHDVHVAVCVCVCVCVCVRMRVSISICMYVHSHACTFMCM